MASASGRSLGAQDAGRAGRGAPIPRCGSGRAGLGRLPAGAWPGRYAGGHPSPRRGRPGSRNRCAAPPVGARRTISAPARGSAHGLAGSSTQASRLSSLVRCALRRACTRRNCTTSGTDRTETAVHTPQDGDRVEEQRSTGHGAEGFARSDPTTVRWRETDSLLRYPRVRGHTFPGVPRPRRTARAVRSPRRKSCALARIAAPWGADGPSIPIPPPSALRESRPFLRMPVSVMLDIPPEHSAPASPATGTSR